MNLNFFINLFLVYQFIEKNSFLDTKQRGSVSKSPLPLNLFKKNNLNYFGDLFTTAETTRTTLLRLELPIP